LPGYPQKVSSDKLSAAALSPGGKKSVSHTFQRPATLIEKTSTLLADPSQPYSRGQGPLCTCMRGTGWRSSCLTTHAGFQHSVLTDVMCFWNTDVQGVRGCSSMDCVMHVVLLSAHAVRTLACCHVSVTGMLPSTSRTALICHFQPSPTMVLHHASTRLSVVEAVQCVRLAG